jgi:hypothetical protein
LNTTALIIVVLLTLLSIRELPALRKKKCRREIAVLLCSVVMGDTIAIIGSNGYELPNPIDGILFLFKPVTEAMTQLLS